MRRDDRGVFTLYEAGLFFIFLLIASSIISAYSMYPTESAQDRSSFSQYCNDSRRAFLSSTIEETTYRTGEGRVERTDLSVRSLLIEEVFLENEGIPRENFSFADDIIRLGNAHFEYGWVLRVSSNYTDDLIIWEGGLIEDVDTMKNKMGDDFTCSSWMEDGLENDKLEITLYLFKR